MPETTLPDLVTGLIALRRAGGYRFKVQERVLRQFADHCRREGYPDGSITKEATGGFLYGRHLRSSTVRRNEVALRQLADHAQDHVLSRDAAASAAANCGVSVLYYEDLPYALELEDAQIRVHAATVDPTARPMEHQGPDHRGREARPGRFVRDAVQPAGAGRDIGTQPRAGSAACVARTAVGRCGRERRMSVIRLLALEVNAVHHCNLACVGCSHASPVTPPKIADPDQVLRDFAGLAGIVVLDHVKVVGGEPLLHPDLAGLLSAIRRSGIGCRIRVATNGTLLHRAGWDWLGAIDDVHISRYLGAVIEPDAMTELAARCERAGKQLLIKSYDHFRLVDPADRLDAADARAVFDSCQLVHAWSCHTVEDGYVYLCPPALPVNRPAEEDARCSIGPRAGLADRLQALLSRQDPLAGCSTCLGSVGNLVPHSQANSKTWVSLSRSGRIDRGQLARLQSGCGSHNGCYVDDEVLPGGAGTPP